MAYLPRGIAPELLFSQVKNTMPYLFDSETGEALARSFPPADVLRTYDGKSQEPLSHFEYFRLCVSSHYLTCGTPVPTDVDNQIRRKLWPAELPLEVALQMADLVIESRHWDFTQVSTRFKGGAFESPWKNQILSGHLGEWFTLSSAAYCALKQYQDPLAAEKGRQLYESISDEVHRHSEIFGSLMRAYDGLGCLKASASVAHNFGDLDRVMDMWELDFGDPLRLGFYKLATTPFDPNGKLRYLGRLWVAGELYKTLVESSSMALENHRHFALRKPRCLRQNPAFLIPTGPFFDDWGRGVARRLSPSQGAPTDETLEVVAALIHGWERLPKTVGYGRALRGMLEINSHLPVEVLMKIPSKRLVLEMSQDHFEKIWSDAAIQAMDEIPSRA